MSVDQESVLRQYSQDDDRAYSLQANLKSQGLDKTRFALYNTIHWQVYAPTLMHNDIPHGSLSK
jgi:hypothetical protein